MLLLEHDAKVLLSQWDVPVPDGYLATPDRLELPHGAGPWMIKAQVPAGGRGKAGGIRKASHPGEVADRAREIANLTIHGHQVRELRIEAAKENGREAYIGFSVDPAEGAISVMMSASGGVDVEDAAAQSMLHRHAEADVHALQRAIDQLLPGIPDDLRPPLREAGHLLARAFMEAEATLLEINPLFVFDDGSWICGDARMAVDESALPRQAEIAALLDRRADAYPDAAFKRAHGYDLVVVDPEGEIGLVTTGAGLSMKLIDEMTARGARPYNFCDIRSGQMRGDPARLIEAMRRIRQGPQLRCILVNIFAGITDLTEFAALLIRAVEALPDLDLPLIVRLAGNGEERAEILLRESGLDLVIERDLEAAIALCTEMGKAHA